MTGNDELVHATRREPFTKGLPAALDGKLTGVELRDRTSRRRRTA